MADVEEVLNRYFDGINFELAQINGYQAQTKEIVIGGGRFPKLAEKEQLNNDTLKLTPCFSRTVHAEYSQFAALVDSLFPRLFPVRRDLPIILSEQR